MREVHTFPNHKPQVMAPKQKAKKLMEDFRIISYDLDDIASHKEHAITAVDAILEQMMGNRAYDFKEKLFWREVKAELQSFQKTPNP